MDIVAIPIEVVHAILIIAAQDHVAECRPWALSLALLNHSIAHLLRPILFYSVIVDERNAPYFAAPGPSDFVLSLTRHLSVIPDVDLDVGTVILARWKPTAGSFLFAHWSLLRDFMNKPEAEALRGIEVRFERLLSAFAGGYRSAPANIAGQLTRVAGYIPLLWVSGDGSPLLEPREWASILCEKLPALTDLGLDLLETAPDWGIGKMEETGQPPAQAEEYLVSLRDVLLALLEIKPQLRICIRAGGDYIFFKALIQRIVVEGVNNSRLRVGFDTQLTEDDDAMNEILVQDAWKGKDTWNVAPR